MFFEDYFIFNDLLFMFVLWMFLLKIWCFRGSKE